MMKTIFAVVVAVAIYVALGALAPITGRTAIVLLPTLLGALGAISFKGLLAGAALGAILKGA